MQWNHGDGCVSPPQVPPPFSRATSRGRVDLLLLPQCFLSSVGNKVTEHPTAGDPRESLVQLPNLQVTVVLVRGIGTPWQMPNHERENHGFPPTLGTHNDHSRKTGTPPSHFPPLPMDCSKEKWAISGGEAKRHQQLRWFQTWKVF